MHDASGVAMLDPFQQLNCERLKDDVRESTEQTRGGESVREEDERRRYGTNPNKINGKVLFFGQGS
jgi:hypothetical protein